MQAGVVGWNAIRVYSPDKQLADWDPQCRFVKHWVPELRDLSSEPILNSETESAFGYPARVVEFSSRARLMKDVLYAIRKSEVAERTTAEVYRQHGSRRKETKFRTRTRKPRRNPQNDPFSQGNLFD